MKTKVCSKCETEKPLNQFNKFKRSKDGLTVDCRKCANARAREWYRNNKKSHQAKHKKYYKKNRESILKKGKEATKPKLVERKRWMHEQKSKPCVDCGKTYPPCCMDFHHLRDKKFQIGSALYVAMPRLLKEIEKCVLLCANCHRIRHQGIRDGIREV